jgi:hypothetical protein
MANASSSLLAMIQNAANNDKEQYMISTATAINNPMQTEITYTCIKTITYKVENVIVHSFF